VPNHLVDGGVVGLSLIAAQILQIPVALFLIIFNLPFIYIGYKKLGKQFAVYSSIGITVLSLLTIFFHSETGATHNPLLAAIFGGVIVGLGVGLVIRNGGTLDGSDTIAILIDRKSSFSIGEVVMFMNIFILSASGFVFGWDNAMYSIVAYYIAHKTIDTTIQGMDESKTVWIVSKKYNEIGDAIFQQIGRKVTYVNGKNAEDIVSDGIIFSVITRLEEQRLKVTIHAIDPSAFIVITGAHEIISKNTERR
jgi:uncharacterized membrane-anchored protein YitT (DUF2179 family)